MRDSSATAASRIQPAPLIIEQRNPVSIRNMAKVPRVRCERRGIVDGAIKPDRIGVDAQRFIARPALTAWSESDSSTLCAVASGSRSNLLAARSQWEVAASAPLSSNRVVR